MATVYLSRRNLLTLLSKLDRAKAGEKTEKTIIKNDVQHEEYPCSERTVVIAVEDTDYYTKRNPGGIVPEDEVTVLMKKIVP
jgi:hypothetical protein